MPFEGTHVDQENLFLFLSNKCVSTNYFIYFTEYLFISYKKLLNMIKIIHYINVTETKKNRVVLVKIMSIDSCLKNLDATTCGN